MAVVFIPKVLRWANFYFFVQNLSAWHHSTRQRHNKDWRGKLTFSPEAEVALQEFEIIHKRYPFGDRYLGRSFFLSENPWLSLKQTVSKNEVSALKHIFSVIEPYFDIIYKEDKHALEEWARLIARPAFGEGANHINETLAKFYGCPPFDSTCTVYLLLSTAEKNGGSSGTIRDDAVTLEVSRMPLTLESQVRGALWHELIHLHFKNFVIMPLLVQHAQGNYAVIQKVEECVASALLPNGLLVQKDAGTESGTLNSRISSETILRVQELIRPYLKGGRSIDENLVYSLCKLSMRDK